MAALLVAAIASPVGATDSDERRAFAAVLKGGNEVPAVDTDGFGFAAIGVNRAETAIGFVLTTFRLENILVAHIHCAPAGVNGPVVADLFGPVSPPGVTKNGLLAHGVITNAQVKPVPDGPCPGGVANFDDLLAQIREGNAYVNVHTTAVGSGEIRGQIK
jgi:hypothetical protein